jgi:hypothetical protein
MTQDCKVWYPVWVLSLGRGIGKHVVYSPAKVSLRSLSRVGECWHLLSVISLDLRGDQTILAYIYLSLVHLQYDIDHFTTTNLHSSYEIQSMVH